MSRESQTGAKIADGAEVVFELSSGNIRVSSSREENTLFLDGYPRLAMLIAPEGVNRLIITGLFFEPADEADDDDDDS